MSKRRSKLTARQLALLDELPHHNWVFAEAGLAAGYAKSTCDTVLAKRMLSDVRFCKAMEQKRRQIMRSTGVSSELLCARFNKIYRLAVEKGDLPSAIQANINLAKHIGWYVRDNTPPADARPIQIAVFTGSPPQAHPQLPESTLPILPGEVVGTGQEKSPDESGAKAEANDAPATTTSTATRSSRESPPLPWHLAGKAP